MSWLRVVDAPPGPAADAGVRPPAPAAPTQRRPERRRWLTIPSGSDALLTMAVLALGVVLLVLLPQAFNVDSWLELVVGRDIWQSGLPHHETFNAMTLGASWVDQQWLAQLAAYGLSRIGGLALLGLVNVGLMLVALGLTLRGARRLGAPAATLLLLLPLCLFLIIPSREVRTQAFALPFMALTLYLLASDSRRASARVFLCLPLLVLWANVHGTVSLGAALVALRGATVAWERRACMRARPRLALRPLALMGGAALSALATPYGLQTVSYYHATLLNSDFKHLVTEWQPITSEWLMALPFFILVGVALWSFGRHPQRTTLWEKLAVILLAAISIDVIRNAVLLGVCALLVVSVSLGDIRPRRRIAAPTRDRLNRVLLATLAALLLVTAAITLAQPATHFESAAQRPGVLAVVRNAAAHDPSLRILTDVRYADWLLWRDPQLAGRIANDARFEVLSSRQLNALQQLFGSIGAGWKRAARGYRLLVLDAKDSPSSAVGFLHEPGRRVLYDDGTRVVILRSAAAAAR